MQPPILANIGGRERVKRPVGEGDSRWHVHRGMLTYAAKRVGAYLGEHTRPMRGRVCHARLIDGKAKHSPTNDWDTNAVWVDAGRAMTVTQERHTEPQDKTLSQTDCHTS